MVGKMHLFSKMAILGIHSLSFREVNFNEKSHKGPLFEGCFGESPKWNLNKLMASIFRSNYVEFKDT